MARPERNTVDYFPFMCDEGKKMFYIEETYGNDGFATFIKILRELAKTEYHYLDLRKNTTQMFLSAKCKVSKDVLLSIINDLSELGKFDINLWNESKIIWCQDFIDSIQDAYKKRNNECITFEGLKILLTSLGILLDSLDKSTVPVKPQSIVKYSKVDKSKENLKFDFKKSLIELGIEEKIVSDWIIVRKKKNASNTETAFNKIKREIEKSNLPSNECIKIAVEKNWCGFECEWLSNIKLEIKNITKKGNNIPKGGW